MGLLQTLGARHQIPQKDPQPDQEVRSETVPESVTAFAKGTQFEEVLKGKDGQTADGEPLPLPRDFWHATGELIMSELGDKTFVILFIFTLAWSNPAWAYSKPDPADPTRTIPDGPLPGYRVFSDGRTEVEHRRTHVGPLRIFLLATTGMLVQDWAMAGETTPGAERRWVFTSAIILVYCLLNYAFRLLSAHFAIVTRLEAEYEASRSQESQRRDHQIQEWAGREIAKSRDFHDEHMESVFAAYEAQQSKESKARQLKLLEAPRARLFTAVDKGETEEGQANAAAAESQLGRGSDVGAELTPEQEAQ